MTLFWDDFGRDGIEYGLDLKGGVHLVYEADLDQLPEDEDADDAMKGVIAVIENRVNAYGVSEPTIQRVGENRIMVQMPGVDNIEEAKQLVGKTVLINFREFRPYLPAGSDKPADLVDNGTPVQTVNEGTPPQLIETDEPAQPADSGNPSLFIMGSDEDGKSDLVNIKEADIPENVSVWEAVPATGIIDEEEIQITSQYFSGKVEFRMYSSTNQPVVAFDWNSTGAKLFEQITGRLIKKPDGSVERRLGIFLGDEMISAPNVKTKIKGSGEITGMSKNEAKRLTSLLNAGRIDVPLERIEEHDVSASLGAKFIDWSKKAGIVGIVLVIFFMALYYRFPGIVAGTALLIYTALVLAAYQLIPVTLTLAGIAGFILSIGMAVDANVLIFERMKEEIRAGRTLRAGVEVGFSRAWPAIRDSNVSTFITCGILYWMGSQLGVPSVQGFALTLFVGVAISMFSAIVITKTFLRLLGSSAIMTRHSLFTSGTRQKELPEGGR